MLQGLDRQAVTDGMMAFFEAVRAKVRSMGCAVPTDYKIYTRAINDDLIHVSMVDYHKAG